MRRKFAAGLLVALTGCQAATDGTAEQLNQVTTGMPKAEVIAKLGAPSSIAAHRSGDYLTYRWMEAVAIVREDTRRTKIAEPEKIIKLRRLFRLRQQGGITKQEYDEQKALLMKR